MAYRRCLLIRGKLIDWKCHPSLSYVFHSDEHKRDCPDEKLYATEVGHFLQKKSFGSSINGSVGFATSSRHGISSNSFLFPCSGYSFCQYMSTDINQGSSNIETMSDVAEVLKDTTMEAVASQVPVVNEVAIAAADSFLPVKALQYLIDAVHSYTGLNWWAAIVLTTLVIRVATLPLLINQLKATSKLTLMSPHLEEIKQQIDKSTDPATVAEGQKQMKKLFNEYGVSPFTPLKGLFIQGPIFLSFFIAISNMAEKVPSFKNGGAYWFLDLSTPDSLYVFPVLAALLLLITVECNAQEGMEGRPVSGTTKNVFRVFAVLTVPFTTGIPKAVFCYWLTSNLFSLGYGLVRKVPGVKKALGVPEIPAAGPTNASQSSFSLFPAVKKATSAATESNTVPVGQSKFPGQKISSSSSVISQRLRSSEKQVKGRKKNRKS